MLLVLCRWCYVLLQLAVTNTQYRCWCLEPRGCPASVRQILVPYVICAVQEAFLSALEALEPDLCVTAAYGNMLPQKLLDMPRLGTLNIHPSLLPKYRGAAPVNRCLENGDSVTGVSVAYTVLKCDVGPVLAQQELALQGDEQVRM